MSRTNIIIGIIALLVLIQFIRIDKTNPPVEVEKDFLVVSQPDVQVAQLVESACYDCHSHKTIYPWYTNIAPLSWWIKGHINEGREHLNFSIWTDYDADKKEHKLEESVEEILEKHMPIASYVWFHPKAKLSDADREMLAHWMRSL